MVNGESKLIFTPTPEQTGKILRLNRAMKGLAPGQAKITRSGDLKRAVALFGKMEEVMIEQPETRIISATTKEDNKIEFDLKERLEYYTEFYNDTGVDWITMPERISLKPEQIKEMKRLMEMGFDHMIIIPEGLVGETEEIKDANGKVINTKNPRYEQLHKLMSEGYSDTYTGTNYDNDGRFQGSQDKNTRFRIILTKDIQELDDDELCKKTLGKSVEDLEAPDGIFKEHGVHGLSESEYLVYQREYFRRTGKHLDVRRATRLPGSRRPLSGRVPRGCWYRDDDHLHFFSDTSDSHDGNLGCRLAGSLNI